MEINMYPGSSSEMSKRRRQETDQVENLDEEGPSNSSVSERIRGKRRAPTETTLDPPEPRRSTRNLPASFQSRGNKSTTSTSNNQTRRAKPRESEPFAIDDSEVLEPPRRRRKIEESVEPTMVTRSRSTQNTDMAGPSTSNGNTSRSRTQRRASKRPQLRPAEHNEPSQGRTNTRRRGNNRLTSSRATRDVINLSDHDSNQSGDELQDIGYRNRAVEFGNAYRVRDPLETIAAIVQRDSFIRLFHILMNGPSYANVDEMGYDELWELQETLGNVKQKGATLEAINSIPVYKYFELDDSLKGDEVCNCTICLTDYDSFDEVKALYCSHVFHKECVDRWLSENASCPVCREKLED
ncbi:hypothetical protein ROZALSC1DRAFT_26930 [Rozella allomycis CSF55]|uniref:RING-type domain-containing protein n=1 Tax=Rozella allomycis (strain CSF55) TaxID=988480 RepID=A0A075AQ73_ROZAC|nr:hypothetical protein O9G_001298 [Rozella allomycis CSF55]RKP21675.1 hypothetical protein ROZALSC1DRAFT_26930 [Rozella allomycis CSF55]|eukprot:EPZ32396.1 hypothetical protein O9G_001298 [Rozella allomycis CSF55]